MQSWPNVPLSWPVSLLFRRYIRHTAGWLPAWRISPSSLASIPQKGRAGGLPWVIPPTLSSSTRFIGWRRWVRRQDCHGCNTAKTSLRRRPGRWAGTLSTFSGISTEHYWSTLNGCAALAPSDTVSSGRLKNSIFAPPWLPRLPLRRSES